jgi:hypothetical protein
MRCLRKPFLPEDAPYSWSNEERAEPSEGFGDKEASPLNRLKDRVRNRSQPTSGPFSERAQGEKGAQD